MSFLSIIVSGIAIYFAIQVPKKIAKEQNKIELFEKRYELFLLIVQCIQYAEDLKLHLKTDENFDIKHVIKELKKFRFLFKKKNSEVIAKTCDSLKKIYSKRKKKKRKRNL